MDFRLQAHARHAQRLLDPFLRIDDVFLRQNVQHFLVGGNRHCLGGIDDALYVGAGDFAVADGDDAVGVHAADVAACNAGIDRMYLAPCHQFRFLDGTLNGLHRGLDIDNRTLLQTAGAMAANADDIETAVGLDVADDGDDFGRADVQTDNQITAR